MVRLLMASAGVTLVMALAAPVAATDEATEPASGPGVTSVEPAGWNPDTGIYGMVFPVDEPHSYSDTWGACRDGCSRSHEGTDIFGAKMTLVFAAADGTVGWMNDTKGGDCCAMALEHDDGWATWYIHMNNDTPGTDDGQGWGFAPGITSGVGVAAGEWIGWVGDSGNAESTSPHVHFELHRPDGTKINPYPHLVASEQPDGTDPGIVAFSSYRIDDGPTHDGTGNDSRGNNDGVVQCGETIKLYATVVNDGLGPLTGLSASLEVSDPFVRLLYNTSSSYPNLDPAESTENPRDWDLRVGSDVPGGHHFRATFTYTANLGGPWVVDVLIPVSCGEDVTPPEIASVSPHHGEFAIAADSNVVVNFNEPVDPATVSSGSFGVEDGVPITGPVTVSPDGMTATFDPDTDLPADTVFTAGLAAAITDLAGNPLGAFSWTFTTGDIMAGAVVDISYRVDDGPSHDGTGNDSTGNNDGAAQCGETIEVYVTARNEGAIMLAGLSGAFSESDPYARLLYNINAPYPDLGPGASAENLSDWDLRIDQDTPIGHVLTATITFSLLDPVTLSLQPIDSVVDVEIPIECAAPEVITVGPGDTATNVPVTDEIKVTFSKPVDAATVDTASFLVAGVGPVAGTVNVAGNGRSATFVADADLAHKTLYSVTLTDGIADRAGNTLVPFASSFMTAEPDLTPPAVIAVLPVDFARAVPLHATVTVTFSEPVDADSVKTESFGVENGGAVNGAVTVAGNGLSATFDPDADLAYESVFSVTLSGAILDLAGNPLDPFSSSFTTVESEPEPGLPVLASYRVDDGPAHDGTGNDSIGNNDGVAHCGETIELYVTAAIVGDLGLTGLAGALFESDGFVTILYNTSAAYPDMGPGESEENPRDWDLRIAGNTPDDHEFRFTVRYTAAEGGPWDVEVVVPIECEGDPDPTPGDPVVVSHRVDDGPSHDGTGNDSRGNDDGIAQCGETIELYITAGNDGESTLVGLSAALLESDDWVIILYNQSAAYPDLPSGVARENPRDWDLRISPDAPGDHEFDFTIRFTADEGGPWDVPVTVPVDCGDPPIPEDPGVPVFVAVVVDDGPGHDGTGDDSKGNNDAAAQCGEVVEVYVRIRNDGDLALTGVDGLLLESDTYVNVLYNTSAPYPNVVAGADAENTLDWDLHLHDDAPDGHSFSFVVRISANGGGTWDLDVTIPISCA